MSLAMARMHVYSACARSKSHRKHTQFDNFKCYLYKSDTLDIKSSLY